MGNRLQKLSLTLPQCSSLLVQQPLFLADSCYAKLNACSGSLNAKVCQLSESPKASSTATCACSSISLPCHREDGDTAESTHC